jgi:hypothetical protein
MHVTRKSTARRPLGGPVSLMRPSSTRHLISAKGGITKRLRHPILLATLLELSRLYNLIIL